MKDLSTKRKVRVLFLDIGEQNQCNFYKTILSLFSFALGSSSLSLELILFSEPVGYSWGRLSYSDGDDQKKSNIKTPKGFQWTPPPPLLFKAPCLIDAFP